MGIRVHQLAKQLEMESQALVELCAELGFPGKKALSSLSDEEVAKIKAYLKSRSSRVTGPAVTSSAGSVSTPQPPKAIRDLGPVREIAPRAKKPPTLAAAKVSSVAVGKGPGSEEISTPPGGEPVLAPVETSGQPGEVAPSVVVPSMDIHPAAFPPSVATAPPTGAGVVVPTLPEEEPEGPPGPTVPEVSPAAEAVIPPETSAEQSPPVSPPSVALGGELAQVDSAPAASVAGELPSSAAEASAAAVVPPVTEPALQPEADTPTLEPREPEKPVVFEKPVAAGPVGKPSEKAPEKRPPLADKLPQIIEKRAKAERPERTDGTERPLPGIILAPIPQAKKSAAAPKEETPVLKPEIRLTPETLRSLRGTRRPLSEYLKQLHSPEKLEELDRAVARLAAGEESPAAPAAPSRPKPKERVKEKPAEKDLREKEKVQPRPTPEPAKPRRALLPEEEEEEFTREREGRPAKRKLHVPKQSLALEEEEEEGPAPSVPITLRRQRKPKDAVTTVPRKSAVVLELPCSVRSFSEAAGVPANVVLGKLLGLGVMANINSSLDQDLAELLAAELGISLQIRAEVDPEEKLRELYDRPDDPAQLVPRAPVVTFLGHVDHGKTSLLDRILGTDVASRERGGITQHIRAYRIFKDGCPITFVDTPGHEAFTAMRARGAQVTDIAVLVVACDDGVMPQTEEAIAHIRAAGVPMVVALNKIDLPGVSPERVLQQLAGLGILPSEWGGDVEVVKTSALTGEGINELLEVLLTVAELHELKANPNRPAVGVCLEASVQAGRGVVAKLLVKKGSLRVGDVVLCGAAHGRIKAMYDTLDSSKRYEEAGPATPVDVSGLDLPPDAGERFYVLEDISEARRIAEERSKRDRTRDLAGMRTHLSLEELSARLAQKEQVEVLHLILRADVRGSLEAVQKEMAKLQHPEVKIEVLQASVGAITEADVELAHASDAIIIGFNVAPTDRALALAEHYGVQIRRYDIIYELTQDLKAALEGMLKPEIRAVELGRAHVLKIFHISRVGTVAGCRVVQGVITRDARMRVIRDGRVIGDYPIQSLRREKDDVREVREGFECGIKLANFDDVKEGDTLEAYRLEEIQRRLESA